MIHRVKTLPRYFQPIIERRKPFEIRKNDRNYKEGDSVFLNEWENGEYTGRVCIVIIKDVFDISFLLPGYVAFTFHILNTFEEIKHYETEKKKDNR